MPERLRPLRCTGVYEGKDTPRPRDALLTRAVVFDRLLVYAFCKLARMGIHSADVAQPVEQLICNQQVGGSSPLIGSFAL
jgi:hypothetical protein